MAYIYSETYYITQRKLTQSYNYRQYNFEMHTSILLGLGLLSVLANAFPVPEENYQRLSRIPPSSSQQYFGDINDDKHTNKPFTPGHRDPYDRKVDPLPDKLQPLPFRNGDGATVMGPRNRDRERQNPDMVRPPSTDHGTLSNMRWSFADSHTRIEVVPSLL